MASGKLTFAFKSSQAVYEPKSTRDKLRKARERILKNLLDESEKAMLELGDARLGEELTKSANILNPSNDRSAQIRGQTLIVRVLELEDDQGNRQRGARGPDDLEESVIRRNRSIDDQ